MVTSPNGPLTQPLPPFEWKQTWHDANAQTSYPTQLSTNKKKKIKSERNIIKLTSPINVDYAMIIWKGKSVLSFAKRFSRHQNSEILSYLNLLALSNRICISGHSKFNMD